MDKNYKKGQRLMWSFYRKKAKEIDNVSLTSLGGITLLDKDGNEVFRANNQEIDKCLLAKIVCDISHRYAKSINFLSNYE